jgi:hypothetical protein
LRHTCIYCRIILKQILKEQKIRNEPSGSKKVGNFVTRRPRSIPLELVKCQLILYVIMMFVIIIIIIIIKRVGRVSCYICLLRDKINS